MLQSSIAQQRQFVSAEEAVQVIRDSQTVASSGVIGWGTPDTVLRAIGQRFESTQSPRNLSFFFPVGVGDAQGIPGMEHVAREGLMRRVISGNFINPVNPATGKRPELMRLIRENIIEAYNWPIGATMHWLREVARRGPGYLTPVGVRTFADPRYGGGKLNERTKEDLVNVVEFEGRELLHYPTTPIDVAIIRASAADEAGNLSWDQEPLISSSIALAIAAKASGGVVIAQVSRTTDSASYGALQNRLPGHLVDYIVIDDKAMMTTDTQFDPAFLSSPRKNLAKLAKLPFSIDKIIASRVASEVRAGELSIYGFGAATDVPLMLAERGKYTDDTARNFPSTTEHGSYGGVVLPGWHFSANLNPDAVLDGVSQFDVINGGLCDFAALSFAECDADGTINVSKFGAAMPGVGGFCDICYNTRRLVFAGTFTTGGLDIAVENGDLKVRREGKISKFVSEVQAVSYRACEGVRERAQHAMIITERAVFNVDEDGLELIEIAPGIDVQTQVIELMACTPVRVSETLKTMAAEHFKTDET